MFKITQKQIINKLSEVLDPELNISIIDLGLIYKIKITDEKVTVVMTLTTVGCPLFSMIESEVKNKIKQLGIKEEDIKINLVFDPPWSIEKMTKRGRAMLGI